MGEKRTRAQPVKLFSLKLGPTEKVKPLGAALNCANQQARKQRQWYITVYLITQSFSTIDDRRGMRTFHFVTQTTHKTQNNPVYL